MANKERGAYYDVDEVRAIPILDVCKEYGLSLKRVGDGRYVCKIRDEKTPSCHIYEKTNSFCDYGTNVSGSVIDLVVAIDGVSVNDAIAQLADNYGIENKNGGTYVKGVDGLSVRQFAKIGIRADLVTANFDIDLSKYGSGLANKWRDKTVWDLAREDKVTYHNMLRARACPYLYNLRLNYYRDCAEAIGYYDRAMLAADIAAREGREDAAVLKMLATTHREEDIERLRVDAADITKRQKWLMAAITDKTLLNPKYFRLDADMDMQKIKEGVISVEVGTVTYPQIKQQSTAENAAVRYAKVDSDSYNRAMKNTELREIGFAAFYKGGEVNICCLGGDLDKVLDIVNRVDKTVNMEAEPKVDEAANNGGAVTKATEDGAAEREFDFEV